MIEIQRCTLSVFALLISIACACEGQAYPSQRNKNASDQSPSGFQLNAEQNWRPSRCRTDEDTKAADASLRSRNYSQAIIILKRMERCNPSDSTVQEKLLYSYLKNHLVQQARAEAENAARGASPERTVHVAHILNSNGDFAGAQMMLTQLIDSGADSADVHAELGRAYLGQKIYEESVRELGTAVQLDPVTESYTIDLASALLSWGNYPTALEFLQAVRGRFGSSPKYLYDLAWAYYGLKQMAHTIEILQDLLHRDPNWDLAHYSLGNAFWMQGDLANAEKQYRCAIALNNGSVIYYTALGRVLREKDMLPEAIAVLDKALILEPRNIEAEFQLALAYTYQRQNEKARRMLEDITTRDPEMAEAHRVLGLVYYRLRLATEGAKQMALAANLSEKARQGGK